MRWTRALGIALGFLADRLLGDPERGHPVAGFGSVATRCEKHTYADSKASGVVHEALLVGGACAFGVLLEVMGRRSRCARTLACAGATFVVLGGTTLGREAAAVAERLNAGDLAGARARVGRIVGRRTTDLTETEVARAAVETVAENTSDAIVAPLLWGAVFGIPGLFGYRAINTLDAMIGHRSKRYRNFGWAAARLDDLANWVPARVSAILVGLAHPNRAKDIVRIVLRDAGQHPSPNAGQVESAFAAALDVQLGGANSYGDTMEHRGLLGDGDPVTASDITRAAQLSRQVSALAAGFAAVLAIVCASVLAAE